ncbi:amidoligase family protein [Curtobacterium sp. CFBP9011]|uniref:amidoligase family protein n=1 Tax=Curtobacterium sp. CFBP9011 TaxID=3096530 RepID=UPI002A6AEA32|nr:amidoligase family protein [Curtobacterium sp. CFBP9011]MDY1003885.1 amidoligase family protein [Curtobacterium sp. CFBP9011]
MPVLHRRIGFEVELLAPEGSDRRALAHRVAAAVDGRVSAVFHTDSEPSLVPGMGQFWHLTPGFDVHDAAGALLASFVDDITLVADIRDAARPAGVPSTADGWFRVLSDDPRLLRLVTRHERADVVFDRLLDTTAALFGTEVDVLGPVRRLDDRSGATVALATALPRGRDRPCEIVTAPVTADHHATLDLLLGHARALGFTVPVEAAVHLHFDGRPFRAVGPFTNLVRLFALWRAELWAALGTNPAATKIRPLPPELLGLTEAGHAWPALQDAARSTGLSKFFDLNLTALLTDEPARDTVEVRILPGSADADEIVERARLVEQLLDRCLEAEPVPPPPPGGGDLHALTGVRHTSSAAPE